MRKILLMLWAAALPLLAGETVRPPLLPPEMREKPMAVTPAGWIDSYPEALARAKAENKLVLLNFTGSDWCGLCQALDQQVFSQPEFTRWAEANVIRLYIDMPQRKKLPPEREKQNKELMAKFGVRGVPMLYFLESSGEPLTSIGYMPGTAADWIAGVNMLLPKRTEIEHNLGAVFTANRTARKPVLITAQVGDFDPDVNAHIAAILASPPIVNNSGANMTVVKIDVTKLDAASLSWWRNLAAKNQIGKKYPVAALFDADWNPLHIAAGRDSSPAAIASDIYTRMPRPAAAAAYRGEWLDDYPAALRIARALDRPLLLAFTGSDWDANTAKLEADLFSKPEFRNFVSSRLVTVKLDFPREKKLEEKLSRQNGILLQSYGIDALPVGIIMRPNGMPLSAFRYNGAPAADYLRLIQQALNMK